MNGLFICGTDTGVGKTIVTGLLAQLMQKRGSNVVTQKWVQTGSTDFPEDLLFHLKMLGKKKEDVKDVLRLMNPYCLKFPASPHLAAKVEKKTLDVKKIVDSFKNLSEMYDNVIVEGIGGALVPLNDRYYTIDIVSTLRMPVVIVVGNKLGAINHTMLTIEALASRNIKIEGLIFNNLYKDENPKVLKDNIEKIEALSELRVFGEIPYSKDVSKLIPIFNKIKFAF